MCIVAGQSNNTSGADGSSREVAAAGSYHYNVEHRVVMDSGGVRVQITKFVKIGSDDNEDDDDDGDFIGEEAFDFGSELEKLFRSMPDISDPNIDAPDPNPDGLNPNMLPGEDGRPSDVRLLEGHPDEHDRVRMNLLDDGMAADPEHVRMHRSGEHGSESTTAVVRASHVIKRDSKRSSLPPRSVFAKLAPSRDRYTILRDEL